MQSHLFIGVVKMAKILEISAENVEELASIGKALSSKMRIEILKLLYYYSLNVNEISEKLNIPASTAGLHIKVLEQAGLINTELQPGTRGSMKLCSRKHDIINIKLKGEPLEFNKAIYIDMPIGAFVDCCVYPTCGLASSSNLIGPEDQVQSFYLPDRINAQLIWTSRGYLEYRFPNLLPPNKRATRLEISAELCSEAPNYRDDWPSDITLWINGVDCGTWTSKGDFGDRRGKLNPNWWELGSTQYGELTTWRITEDGIYINKDKVSDTTISSLNIEKNGFITVRIGNAPDAKYKGGFNIFGNKFGDFEQNLVMRMEY